ERSTRRQPRARRGGACAAAADVEGRAAGAHDARARQSADAPPATGEVRATDRRADAAGDAERRAPDASRAAGDDHTAEAGADPGDGSSPRAAPARTGGGGGTR